jgi:uncharacterized protein Usg
MCILIICFHIKLSDYALMVKLFCFGDLGAHPEMQKIRETICMWQDCLQGLLRENWKSILLLREKYVVYFFQFI